MRLRRLKIKTAYWRNHPDMIKRSDWDAFQTRQNPMPCGMIGAMIYDDPIHYIEIKIIWSLDNPKPGSVLYRNEGTMH